MSSPDGRKIKKYLEVLFFIYIYIYELKECPCVAWMARKGKYSSFNGYFLYFKLARNASTTGCPRMLLQRPGVGTLDTLATNCIQKWFNFPSQWCVQMAHTPLTTHARNVWIPTFLISHSSQSIFVFRAKKKWIKFVKGYVWKMPKEKWKSDAFKGRAWSALLRCSAPFHALS